MKYFSYRQIMLMVILFQTAVLVVLWWSSSGVFMDRLVRCMLILAAAVAIDCFLSFFFHMDQTRRETLLQIEEMEGTRRQEQEAIVRNQEYLREAEEVRNRYLQQMQEVTGLLKAGASTEKIQDALQKSNEFLTSIRIRKYCDHPMVNAILTSKHDKAEQEGITMRISVQLPEQLPVAPLDLCSLFCNLLDNALEACEKITVPDIEKKIDIKAGIRRNYLLIRVTNTIQKPLKLQGGHAVTTKADVKNHGIGLAMIRQIAEKYQGAYVLKQTTNDTVEGNVSLVLEEGNQTENTI